MPKPRVSGGMAQKPQRILNPSFSKPLRSCLERGMGGRKTAGWRRALCYSRQKSLSVKTAMNYRSVKNGYNGFVFLPIMLVVAVVAILGGGGAIVYHVEKQNNSEKDRLKNEISELKKPSPSPSEESVITPEPIPTPIAPQSTTSKTEAISVKKPIKIHPTPSPVIVVSPKPTPALVKVTPVPTSSPFIIQPQPTTNVFELQQKAEQERIARVRQQLQSAISGIDGQIETLGQQIAIKRGEIEDIRNTVGVSMYAVERRAAPVIAELNSLIFQYNSLIDQRAPLVRELLSL